jgi:hypothetical protein
MNYNKKKYLFLIKWVNTILPLFNNLIICFLKPLNIKNSVELRKNLKNIKVVSSSILKGSPFFNQISSLRVFSGKITIIYFNNLVEVKQYLNIVEKQKFLVPLLYYNSNRFIKTSEVLIKNQLKKYINIKNLENEQHIALIANIYFVNSSCQKMLAFHRQTILYLINNEN